MLKAMFTNFLERILGSTSTRMKPAIVWRNPKPTWRKERWQLLDRRVDRSVYIVQELVRTRDADQWVTTSAFEVVQGRRILTTPEWLNRNKLPIEVDGSRKPVDRSQPGAPHSWSDREQGTPYSA